MTSIFGFVAKDTGVSNTRVAQVVQSPSVSTSSLNVTNLSVTNLSVTQQLSTSNASTSTNVHNLTISQTLTFQDPKIAHEIVFHDTATNGLITLSVSPVTTSGIVYTIPDVGVNANFVLTEGNQEEI